MPRQKEKLDTKKWNAILASLLFLSGKEDDGVFNQFFVTNMTRGEMNAFYDAYVKRTNNPSVVPQTQLQTYVQKFFKVGRSTFLKHLNRMKSNGIVAKKRLPLRGKLFGCIFVGGRPSKYFIYSKEDEKKGLGEFVMASMKTEFVDSAEFNELLAEIVDARPVKKFPPTKMTSAEIFRNFPELRKAFNGYLDNYYRVLGERYPFLMVTHNDIGILGHPPEVKAREILAGLLRNVNLRAIAEIRDDILSERICPICLTKPVLHITDPTAPYAVGVSFPRERKPEYLVGEETKVCTNCGYTSKTKAKAEKYIKTGVEKTLSPKEMGNVRYPKKHGLGSYSKYEDQIMMHMGQLKKEMSKAGIEL